MPADPVLFWRHGASPGSTAEILRPGAHPAYVMGEQALDLRAMTRTGHILAAIARSLGYDVLAIDLFRTRIATVTNEQMHEEVVVLRWNG